MTPVTGLVDGVWSFGFTYGNVDEGKSEGDPVYGSFFQIPANVEQDTIFNKINGVTPLYGVKATGACPATFQRAQGPAEAIQYQGVPLCWDFNSGTNAFTPYARGACIYGGYGGPYELVKDFPA